MAETGVRSKLTLFDVTNLVVGSIIGADIYVASAFGAGLLGPFSLVVWVVAGIIAMIIALCFAQCSALLPKVGGPYAYAHEAWGPFVGFTVGWSLWLAEWMSLAVFPVAFTQYLMFFFPSLTQPLQLVVKTLFVLLLTLTNVAGVKAAGRTNDVLTIVKLAPLVFFAVAGIVYIAMNVPTAASNLTPFLPYGLGSFGSALVLIFWAYAGFEISTIPAEEIREPAKTIPKAIIIGIAIVTVFYLVTNIVLFAIRPWSLLQNDKAPLTTAINNILAPIPLLALVGTLIVGVGALISVAGSDESGMIGTSQLGYALSADGLFPRSFAKIHPRFKTPYLGIIIQAATALAAALIATFYINGLSTLIATSVFFMAVAYVATSASIYTLRKRHTAKFNLPGGLTIPILAAAFSIYLITQCNLTQIGLGLILLLTGMPIYVKYSPKKEIAELKQVLLNRQNILKRLDNQEHVFLAHVLRHIKKLYRKTKQT
ncbi:MAG TPA: amino acid permease [candidate division Zixibacteria bacterium]|nr:amino acid permease [candidate division Zixibacteria bacterium]